MFLKRLSTLLICVQVCVGMVMGTNIDSQATNLSLEKASLLAPNALTFDAVPVSPTCNDGNNGYFVIKDVSPSVSSYTYEIRNAANTIVLSGPFALSLGQFETPHTLKAGTYSVKITYNEIINSVSTPVNSTISRIVLNPSKIDVVYDQLNSSFPNCPGETATFAFTAQGGTGALSYELSNNGAALAPQTTGTFTNLTTGNYTLKVTDANNCWSIYDQPLVVQQLSDFNLSHTIITEITCEGELATVKINGLPTEPYTIQFKKEGTAINTPAQDAFGFRLSAGSYEVSVFRNSCPASVKTVTFTVEGFGPVTIAYNGTVFPYTLNCTDDVLDLGVTVNGGNANRNLVVRIQNAEGTYDRFGVANNYGSTFDFENLPAGNYTLTWNDELNASCVGTSTFKVNGPTSPIAYSAQPYPVKEFICAGSNSGQIRIPVTGGSGTYTYYYKLVSAAAFLTSTSNTISGLSEGIYAVYAEDSNGCKTNEENVEIKAFPAITVNLSPTAPVLCESNTDGSVSATIQGGSGSYVYNITGPTTKTGDVTSSLSVTGLSVGSYSIAISDKECTTATPFNDVFEIEATYNTVLFVSESKTPVTCDNTGASYEIVATDNSGNLLTYSLSNANGLLETKQGSAGVTFTGLTNGLYSVSVTNGGSCNILERPVSIAEYKSFTIQGVSTQSIMVDCFGEEGVLPLTVQGGNGPFQYRVDAGTWSSDFTDVFVVDNGLTSSISGVEHLVEVQDVNGCVKSFKVLVKSPSVLDYTSPVVQDLSCKGNATGVVTVEVTGGSPTYTAAMNGIVKTGTSNIVFDKLSAGDYNITIVDSKGCDLGSAIPVSVKEPLEVFTLTTPTFEEIKCFGGRTTVEVSTTGGWGTGVTYNLKGGGKDTIVSNGIFTDIKAGNYTVTATNADGCSNSISFSIEEPTRLVMTYKGKSDISCKDRTDGKIVIEATGGTAPYSYGLEGVNSSFYPFTLSPVDTIRNLAQGTYNIIVQDANGCQSSIQSITINEPDPIVVSLVSYKDVECYSQNNGEIVLTAVGGIGTKEFTIVAGTVPARSNNTGSFNNLPPADYQITVTDANLCSNPLPLSQVISEPKEIFVTQVDPIDVKCFNGSDGAVEITASGGQPFDGLLYSIKDYPLAPQKSNLIEGLKKGIYTVIVTDSRGKCPHEKAGILVDSPDQLEFVTKLFTDVTCHNAEDGTIERTVRGGTPNFSYNLYNENDGFIISSTDGKFSGLGQQNKAESYYKVVVIDGNDCKIEDNVKIINPPAITVEPIVIEPVRCYGENNGSIHIKAIGGTGELKYSLDGGVTFNSATDPLFASIPGKYTKLAPKFYTPWVTDKNNCTPGNYPTKVQVEVVQPEELTATYELDSISCFDTKDAEITINAQGGNEEKPYEYSVDNETTWQSENIFKNVVPNLYKLVVKDWKGCKLAIAELDVTNPALIDLLIDSTAITCFDDNDATLRFRANGGVGPFTVSTKPLFDVGSTETYTGNKLDVTYEDLQADVEYSYYIRDKEKCPVNTINGQVVKMETSDPVLKHTFLNPPKLIVFAVDTMPERCAGEKGGSISIHAKGGVEPLEFNVQSANTSVPYHSTWSVEDSVITRLVADNYYVLVRDAHGCKPVDTDFTPKTWTVRAQNRTEMVITVWDSEDANCPYSQDGRLNLGVRNTFENTFSWTITAKSEFEPYKLGTNNKDSLVLIEELPAQDYIFEVTDLASLCTSDTTVTVPYSFDACEDLVIPTAFTPNGDSYNDTWRIENIELYSKMKIQIYTVNGEKVLDVDGPFEGEWGWNGQLNNDGRYLPSGTYIVLIWKDFDLVGRVKSKEDSTTNTGTNTSNSTTADGDSTANTTKAKNGKPDYIGNVTILRNF